MQPSTLETADLYNDRLTADLAGMRLLADQTVRRIFATSVETAGPLREEHIVGIAPSPNGSADLRAITGFNFRQGLFRYLVNTGRLIVDSRDSIHVTPGLAVSAEEEQQARMLTAVDSRLAAIAEVLSAFEAHGQKLLQGEDGARVLIEHFGFKRMQAVWESQALQMPQRLVERTLCARMLLDRMRKQRTAMTVLEAGAGVGAVLRRALEVPEFMEHLQVIDRYVYTDISPFLIEWSKDWFRRHAPAELLRKMEFRVLDLDAIEEADVCVADSVDLVIMDDVAHDVVDLHRTLAGLRGLLRRDGWLTLTENFRQPPQDFLYVEIFPMTLHGYNKARLEPRRREQHGFMTLEQWRSSLQDAGFPDLRIYPDPACHSRWPGGGIVASGHSS